eukprot:7782669-Prorocentrum_lima.AAC.1
MSRKGRRRVVVGILEQPVQAEGRRSEQVRAEDGVRDADAIHGEDEHGLDDADAMHANGKVGNLRQHRY